MKPVMAAMALSLVASATAAQDDSAKSGDEIARELANPNNSRASLTFKNQYRWYGDDLPNADDQANYTLLFQPVFPFSLNVTPVVNNFIEAWIK